MKKKYFIVIIAYLVFFVVYSQIPDFKECSSISTRYDNYNETILNVAVYKAPYNKYQYQLIKKHHTEINDYTADKLILRLFHSEYAMKKGKQPYCTVVFDEVNNVSYIELHYD